MKTLFVTFLMLFGLVPSVLAHAPKVVASIAPIHSLVASVMNNIGEPALLVPGNKSPHAYSLRPSDARALANADLVFWIGPGFELFLDSPLKTLAANATIVAMAEDSALKQILLGAQNTAQENFDFHLWLDPSNAQAMLLRIARVLAQSDPDNAHAYRANAQTAIQKIDRATAEIKTLLAPVRSQKFVFYHDAYRYFEEAFSLTSSATLVTNPDLAPGARRVAEMRRLIASENIACVFSEPQFAPAIVRTLTQGTSAGVAILDPLGANLAPGPSLYTGLLRQMAQSMADCLTR